MTVSQMKKRHSDWADDARYLAILNGVSTSGFCATAGLHHGGQLDRSDRIAVQQAVTEGRRLVVTSGGHCLEDLCPIPKCV